MAHGHDFADEHRDPKHYTGADAQYFETPPGAGYEHTDASVWTIAKFGLWLAVSALVVHLGLGFFYGLLVERSIDVSEPRYPLAVNRDQPTPPAPQLQRDPRSDVYQFRQEEDAALNEYRWLNREAGRVQIPIAEAMRRVVEEGLPSRTQDASHSAPAVPGMIASDASSGRVLERRRQ